MIQHQNCITLKCLWDITAKGTWLSGGNESCWVLRKMDVSTYQGDIEDWSNIREKVTSGLVGWKGQQSEHNWFVKYHRKGNLLMIRVKVWCWVLREKRLVKY